ncbi:MAG: phosphotransferase family protein [Acidimicrobiales bacterium]
MAHDTTALRGDLVEWIERVTGTKVAAAVRQVGGGRKQGWLVLLASGEESLFLRWDPTDLQRIGDPWTVRREATVYAALDGAGIKVAPFRALHPTDEAVLLGVVHGESRFSAITDGDQARAVAEDFIGQLAALHRLDVSQLEPALPGGDRSVPQLAVDQLDELEELIAFRGGVPDALLGIALPWLRAHVPDYDGRPVLVQGDTGPGNFLYDGRDVTAIVDWELAHLGDPMDDLAWVTLRSVQDPFPDLPALFAAYSTASGIALDADRLRYYRVLAEAKIMTMGHGVGRRERAGGDGGDPGGRLIFGQLHRRLLVEVLADAMGVELPDIALPIDEVDEHRAALYGSVADQIHGVVLPRVDDGFARARLKGLARVVKYLEASDRAARAYAADECVDLGKALGHDVTDVHDGRRDLAEAVSRGEVDPVVALLAVHGRTTRHNELLRSASGALADRHYQPVTELIRSPAEDERSAERRTRP